MTKKQNIKYVSIGMYKQLEEENKKLKDDIKKWEDRWMVKLAEIYVMPTRELTTAIAKNEWFSSWYDTVKKKMLHELGFDRLDVQDLLKENKKLKERIDTMQEFIDYSGGIVQNAIGMLYEEGGEDKALDYLENCYVIGDEGLYEEMEKMYKDED